MRTLPSRRHSEKVEASSDLLSSAFFWDVFGEEYCEAVVWLKRHWARCAVLSPPGCLVHVSLVSFLFKAACQSLLNIFWLLASLPTCAKAFLLRRERGHQQAKPKTAFTPKLQDSSRPALHAGQNNNNNCHPLLHCS